MPILWFAILTLPFFIPAHFYPLPTYPEELVTSILVIAFGITGLLSSRRKIAVSDVTFLWLAFGFVWLLSWLVNQKSVVAGAFFYQIFWVLGLFALIVGSSFVNKYGRKRVSELTARFFVFSGFLYAATGLFSYYGGLKFVIPWIKADYPRLMGLMEHPNLSGLFLAISLAAFWLCVAKRGERLFHPKHVVFVLLVVLAGVLTGSRAFFLILLVQLVHALVFYLRSRKAVTGYDQAGNRSAVIYQAGVFALAVVLFFAYPPVDKELSEALTESGFLERQATSEMLSERFQARGQPRIGEWRKIFQGYSVIDNVWVGVGPGAYPVFSVAADSVIDQPFRNGKTWRNAHNILLMAFVEWGVVGVALVIATLFFLLRAFLRSAQDPQNYFVWSAIAAILAHNFVEFSLWYLPFLTIFLVLLSTQFKVRTFTISSPVLRWVAVIPTVLLSAWIGAVSTRDYAQMVYIVSKPEVGEQEIKALDLIAQNSMWRPYARLVMYYRLNPFATGIENQLREVSAIAEWSPMNLVLMRQASLTAALGEKELGCKRIRRATQLYPSIAPTLDEELVYLDSKGLPIDLPAMRKCFSSMEN
jgi:O-antigen ligase